MAAGRPNFRSSVAPICLLRQALWPIGIEMQMTFTNVVYENLVVVIGYLALSYSAYIVASNHRYVCAWLTFAIALACVVLSATRFSIPAFVPASCDDSGWCQHSEPYLSIVYYSTIVESYVFLAGCLMASFWVCMRRKSLQ